MNRGDVLDKVKGIICQDRQDVHGAPEDTHGLIAQYWNVYLAQLFALQDDVTLSARNVAEMMVLFKMARQQMNPMHTDNLIDAIGYAAIAAELTPPCETATIQLSSNAAKE